MLSAIFFSLILLAVACGFAGAILIGRKVRLASICLIGCGLYLVSSLVLYTWCQQSIWRPREAVQRHNSCLRIYWAGYKEGLRDAYEGIEEDGGAETQIQYWKGVRAWKSGGG